MRENVPEVDGRADVWPVVGQKVKRPVLKYVDRLEKCDEVRLIVNAMVDVRRRRNVDEIFSCNCQQLDVCVTRD